MLKSLTSLRFVFAFMVFLSHATFVSDETSILFTGKYWFKQGFVGVNFFFILSGFILSFTYFERLKNLNGNSLRRFYFKRFLKIYPSFWITLLLSLYFAQELWTQSNHQGILVSNILLLQAWFPDKFYQWYLNPPAWSLSVEVFFYVCFPFIIFLLHKIKARYFHVFVILSFLVQAFLTLYFGHASDNHFWYYIFPVSNFILFLTGISIYLVYSEHYEVLKKLIGTFTEIVALCLFATAVYFSNLLPDHFRYICYYLPFAALLVGVFSFQAGKISELLSHRVPEYLGKISFQFYLWHFLAIWFWCKMDYLYLQSLSQQFIVVLSFTTTMILSIISYHLLELPIQKIFR